MYNSILLIYLIGFTCSDLSFNSASGILGIQSFHDSSINMKKQITINTMRQIKKSVYNFTIPKPGKYKIGRR